MPLSYNPGMDYCNHANRLRTISPSVPAADHAIPVPLPSPDMSKMLPLPTPPNKGKDNEKDQSNVGRLLMDLAQDGSEDGTSTPTENDAGTILPAPTGKEAGTTPENPTNPKPKGTPKPDRPATPGRESSTSDDNNTEDEE